MIVIVGIGIWIASSPLVAWLAGRFIRVGMVELQPDERPRDAT